MRGHEEQVGDFAYEHLPSSLPEDRGSPPLIGFEAVEWDAIPNLDVFFRNIYKYYEEKGFIVMLLSRGLNLLALLFTTVFSAFLLLGFKWNALNDRCLIENTCDISEVVIEWHPLHPFTLWKAICCVYVAFFTCYCIYSALHLLKDVRDASEVRHFTQHRLGLSERQLKTVSWPEVARRIVEAQQTTRLCLVRDLTEHDVVSRIMRKDNYLIGMLNKGVLALHVSLPCTRRHFMLTKTLEWNLYFCIFDHMFDNNFNVRPEFVDNPQKLQQRFRFMALVNLICCPFVLMFLLIYFFMRNAEKFYHHPSTAGARRWSSLAAWRLREFNELPHYLHHRLNASTKAAEHYIAQFPSYLMSHIAQFVAFVAGSFAALLLLIAFLNDVLLERSLVGHHVVWWVASLGLILAVARAFIQESGVAYEPELALLEVVAHTHHLPRHWRGRAHTREVQEQFEQLFQYKALLLLEEMASVVLTPFVLYFSLPKCAPAITRFVRDFTTSVDGVGDICSLSAFDFSRHGNSKYGSPLQAPKGARSKQGKMEKSFLSFAATYPTWAPERHGKQFLTALNAHPLHGSPHFPVGAVPPAAAPISTFSGLAAHQNAASVMPGGAYGARVGAHSVALSRYLMVPRNYSTGGSIFGSAEMGHYPQQPRPEASISHSAVSDIETRVGTAQTALQIMYEDRDREARLGSLHALHPDRGFPHDSRITIPHNMDAHAHRSLRSSPDNFGRPPLARDHLPGLGSRAPHPAPRREIAMTDRRPHGAPWAGSAGPTDPPTLSSSPAHGAPWGGPPGCTDPPTLSSSPAHGAPWGGSPGCTDPPTLSSSPARGGGSPPLQSLPQEGERAMPLPDRRGAADERSAEGRECGAGAAAGPVTRRKASSADVPSRPLSPSAGLSPAWTRGSPQRAGGEEAEGLLAGADSWTEETDASMHEPHGGHTGAPDPQMQEPHAGHARIPDMRMRTSEQGGRGCSVDWGGAEPAEQPQDRHAPVAYRARPAQGSGAASLTSSAVSAAGVLTASVMRNGSGAFDTSSGRDLNTSAGFRKPLSVGMAAVGRPPGTPGSPPAPMLASSGELDGDMCEAGFLPFGDGAASVGPEEADPLGVGLGLSGGRWSGVTHGGPIAWRADLSSGSGSATSPSGRTAAHGLSATSPSGNTLPHGFSATSLSGSNLAHGLSASAGSPNTASSGMSAASSEGSGVLAGRPTWGGSGERLFLAGIGESTGASTSRLVATPRMDPDEGGLR